MPNAKVLSEKQAIVAALAERLNSASAGVFVDYKGITVDEDTKLRTELRQNDVEYSVVKNTLTRFALKDAGLEAMSDLLNGTTSLATSTADPIVPIRMIHDMSEKMAKDNKFIVKGAFLEGKVLNDAEIAEIAQLQNKDALYSSSRWAVLPHRLPRPKLPPPNKATTSLNYLGGKLPWLAKKSLL